MFYVEQKVKSYNKFKQSHCVACGHSGNEFNPLDVDHIKTQGSGGHDAAYNCWTLCRTHHIEKGLGLKKFSDRWPKAKEWLIKNGWEYDEFLMKWINTKAQKIQEQTH
jgi:hypothetical protein